MHKHKCYACSWIWEHSDSCVNDEQAHTCPKCGQPGIWLQYRGFEVPAGSSYKGKPTGGFFADCEKTQRLDNLIERLSVIAVNIQAQEQEEKRRRQNVILSEL